MLSQFNGHDFVAAFSKGPCDLSGTAANLQDSSIFWEYSKFDQLVDQLSRIARAGLVISSSGLVEEEPSIAIEHANIVRERVSSIRSMASNAVPRPLVPVPMGIHRRI